MDIGKLEKELVKKLPPEEIYIDIERGVASYYDYDGVTFRDNDAEQRYVKKYIVRVISEKAGFPIKITRETDGNGHCAHYFVRIVEE